MSIVVFVVVVCLFLRGLRKQTNEVNKCKKKIGKEKEKPEEDPLKSEVEFIFCR